MSKITIRFYRYKCDSCGRVEYLAWANEPLHCAVCGSVICRRCRRAQCCHNCYALLTPDERRALRKIWRLLSPTSRLGFLFIVIMVDTFLPLLLVLWGILPVILIENGLEMIIFYCSLLVGSCLLFNLFIKALGKHDRRSRQARYNIGDTIHNRLHPQPEGGHVVVLTPLKPKPAPEAPVWRLKTDDDLRAEFSSIFGFSFDEAKEIVLRLKQALLGKKRIMEAFEFTKSIGFTEPNLFYDFIKTLKRGDLIRFSEGKIILSEALDVKDIKFLEERLYIFLQTGNA